MSPVSLALRRARRCRSRRPTPPRSRACAGAASRRARSGSPLDPALARAVFEPFVTPLTGPLVADQPSETAPLPAAAELHHLARPQRPRHAAHRRSAGRRQHAAVRAAAPRAAARLRDRRAAHRPRPRARRAGRGHRARAGRRHAAPTPWARLAAPLDGVTAAGQTLGAAPRRRARGQQRRRLAGGRAAHRVPRAARRACASSSRCRPRRSARLAGGVLDLASHRLDAWVSAHGHAPARHAAHARRPLGVRLGGYGVLEDVRPATAAQAASHGYIHAPSLGQAATAAVLRSGHLAHAGGPDAPLALDLSSRRVRLALAPARRRPRRPAARRAARLPPGARPARGPPRARPRPLHRRAARRSRRWTRSPRPSTT